MKIDQLIEQLEQIKNKLGNVNLKYKDYDFTELSVLQINEDQYLGIHTNIDMKINTCTILYDFKVAK